MILLFYIKYYNVYINGYVNILMWGNISNKTIDDLMCLLLCYNYSTATTRWLEER